MADAEIKALRIELAQQAQELDTKSQQVSLLWRESRTPARHMRRLSTEFEECEEQVRTLETQMAQLNGQDGKYTKSDAPSFPKIFCEALLAPAGPDKVASRPSAVVGIRQIRRLQKDQEASAARASQAEKELLQVNKMLIQRQEEVLALSTQLAKLTEPGSEPSVLVSQPSVQQGDVIANLESKLGIADALNSQQFNELRETLVEVDYLEGHISYLKSNSLELEAKIDCLEAQLEVEHAKNLASRSRLLEYANENNREREIMQIRYENERESILEKFAAAESEFSAADEVASSLTMEFATLRDQLRNQENQVMNLDKAIATQIDHVKPAISLELNMHLKKQEETSEERCKEEQSKEERFNVERCKDLQHALRKQITRREASDASEIARKAESFQMEATAGQLSNMQMEVGQFKRDCDNNVFLETLEEAFIETLEEEIDSLRELIVSRDRRIECLLHREEQYEKDQRESAELITAELQAGERLGFKTWGGPGLLAGAAGAAPAQSGEQITNVDGPEHLPRQPAEAALASAPAQAVEQMIANLRNAVGVETFETFPLGMSEASIVAELREEISGKKSAEALAQTLRKEFEVLQNRNNELESQNRLKGTEFEVLQNRNRELESQNRLKVTGEACGCDNSSTYENGVNADDGLPSGGATIDALQDSNERSLALCNEKALVVELRSEVAAERATANVQDALARSLAADVEAAAERHFKLESILARQKEEADFERLANFKRLADFERVAKENVSAQTEVLLEENQRLEGQIQGEHRAVADLTARFTSEAKLVAELNAKAEATRQEDVMNHAMEVMVLGVSEAAKQEVEIARAEAAAEVRRSQGAEEASEIAWTKRCREQRNAFKEEMQTVRDEALADIIHSKAISASAASSVKEAAISNKTAEEEVPTIIYIEVPTSASNDARHLGDAQAPVRREDFFSEEIVASVDGPRATDPTAADAPSAGPPVDSDATSSEKAVISPAPQASCSAVSTIGNNNSSGGISGAPVQQQPSVQKRVHFSTVQEVQLHESQEIKFHRSTSMDRNPQATSMVASRQGHPQGSQSGFRTPPRTPPTAAPSWLMARAPGCGPSGSAFRGVVGVANGARTSYDPKNRTPPRYM